MVDARLVEMWQYVVPIAKEQGITFSFIGDGIRVYDRDKKAAADFETVAEVYAFIKGLTLPGGDMKLLKISERRKLLCGKMEEIFPGIIITECETCIAGKTNSKSRGKHIDIKVPATKKDETALLGRKFSDIFNLVDENLCDITWDGEVNHGLWGGDIPSGYYYTFKFDKV